MIKLTEEKIIAAMTKWLDECDMDELARICGETFGGKCTCYFDPEESHLGESCYEFEPDENYTGEFGDIK